MNIGTLKSTGKGYSHTGEELEFRRAAAGNVGIDRVLSPNGTNRADRNLRPTRG
jgi:hypothetical protein